jgi:hypothetical protein
VQVLVIIIDSKTEGCHNDHRYRSIIAIDRRMIGERTPLREKKAVPAEG